ncbi:hypothetical protein BH24ACT26_BH24ACT26_19850 [soil metagenome]
MDVPQARQIARPAWLNLRTVLGLLLFCFAFLAGHRALENARTTVPVWTAARDLGLDTELEPADLTPAEVRLPAELMARYAPASVDVTGAVLQRPVRAGEMIPLEWVAAGPSTEAGRSMTIPLTPENGVGGALRSGDRVDVLVTFDAGDARARTIPIVRDIEIVEVVRSASLVVEEDSLVGVTVAVTLQEATSLAFALRSGEIDLARVEGVAGSDEATTVRASDLQ